LITQTSCHSRESGNPETGMLVDKNFWILRSSRRMTTKKHKAQVFIETTLFFVATILLLLMVIRVWVWSNNQIAARQPAYNHSRVEAGTVAPPDRAAPLIWVVENEARGDRRVYTPERLTRDWVFRGQQ